MCVRNRAGSNVVVPRAAFRSDLVEFGSAACRSRQLWRVALDVRCRYGYQLREWVNWLNGRPPFDATVAMPAVPTRDATVAAAANGGSRTGSSIKGGAQLLAAFGAGAGHQTPRSITDALTFIENSMLSASSPAGGGVGGVVGDSGGGALGASPARSPDVAADRPRRLFSQYVAALIFPMIFRVCERAMDFVYCQLAAERQRRGSSSKNHHNRIARMFSADLGAASSSSTSASSGSASAYPVEALRKRWVTKSQPLRAARQQSACSRWKFLVCSSVGFRRCLVQFVAGCCWIR